MTAHRTTTAPPSADQLVLDLPGIPTLTLLGASAHPRRATVAAARLKQPPTAAGESVVGERVWLVWEDDDVLGVYNDPTTAAADCGALRRHSYRDQLGLHYEWMAVPVFTGRRHQLQSGSSGPARPVDDATRAFAGPRDRVDHGCMSTGSDTPDVDPRDQADPNSAEKPREPGSKDDAEAAARAKSPADDQPDDPDPS